MLPTLWTVFVVAVFLQEAACVSDICAKYSDGCSVPLNEQALYEDTFTPACYRHDVCYGCGFFLFGVSRNSCDNGFLNSMKQACASRGTRSVSVRAKRSLLCEVAADIYYEAVRNFAGSHYSTSPQSYCNETWVQSCIVAGSDRNFRYQFQQLVCLMAGVLVVFSKYLVVT